MFSPVNGGTNIRFWLNKTISGYHFQFVFYWNSNFNVVQGIIDITDSRPPDRIVYLKIIFLPSPPKYMLWVFKRTVSMRQFF